MKEVMKQALCLLGLLVLLVCQYGNADQSFARTNGTHFVLDGHPFYFNGFNAYWLMYMAADPDPSGKVRVSSAFQQASTLGQKVIRTWGFSDGGYRPLQISPGSYNENMFKALDFVISEARQHNLLLILSLVNNWNDYGGKQQYVQWAKDKGHLVNSDDDFFKDEVIKGYYKDHIKAVLTRVNTITGVAYKDEPTIFAWELMNEPRFQNDLSGSTLQAWITEMAYHVKSIDSNHMLEIGMEGFYGESAPERKQFNPGYEVGTDFISNHQIKGIDFATIHAYPDQWTWGLNDDAQIAFVEKWLQAHAEDTAGVLKMPLVFAEFGKSSRQSGYTVDKRDAFFGAIFDQIYASAKTAAPGGGGSCAGALFWQLQADGMDNFGDGYEVVISKSPSTANVISQQAQRMTSLNA